ncbi:MAG: histidine phosphatase family protein, partial [Nocardioides sp.]|nr:histidine phosphatase family protein [Nocardioides sp.]
GAGEGLDHATVRARWPESYADGAINPRVTPPGGESMTTFCTRVLDFLTEVVACPARVPIYVITHNGWIRTAKLVNGDVGPEELFATPEPFLEPIPFMPRTDLWCNPFSP